MGSGDCRLKIFSRLNLSPCPAFGYTSMEDFDPAYNFFLALSFLTLEEQLFYLFLKYSFFSPHIHTNRYFGAALYFGMTNSHSYSKSDLSLGPKLILVHGLVKFVRAGARLVCPDLLNCFANINFSPVVISNISNI